MKRAVAEFHENRIGSPVPTRPTQRRVSIHVLCVELGAGIQKQLYRFLGAECGSPVERRFAFGPAISHERAGFHCRFGHGVGICASREQYFDDEIIGFAICLGERGVQRRFSGPRVGLVHVGTLLNQELAQWPMAMIGSAYQIEVVPKRVDGFSVSQQKPDRADISVVPTPVDERRTVGIVRGSGVTSGEIVENQISASILDTIEKSSAHGIAPFASVSSIFWKGTVRSSAFEFEVSPKWRASLKNRLYSHD